MTPRCPEGGTWSGTVSQVPHFSHRRFGSTCRFRRRLVSECPQRDSNPRYHLERVATWAASRWGRPERGYPRSELPSVAARAVSSAGRAPALHAGGRRFESCTAHLRPLCPCGKVLKPWVSRGRNLGTCETVRPPVRLSSSAERACPTQQTRTPDLRRDSSVRWWPPWVTRGQTLGNKRLSLERYVGVGQRSSARSDTNLTRMREEPDDCPRLTFARRLLGQRIM